MENTFDKQKIHSIFSFLRIVYGIVPIVAGLDKFTNILTNWQNYINPAILKMLPVSGQTFMYVVGAIEILAGIIVIAQPRIGAYIVSAWLVLISLSLLASGNYLDVAVRDMVMAIGAYTLARLSEVVEHEHESKKEYVVTAVNR